MSALDFHHLDPSQKDFGIAGGAKSWIRMVPELNKCVLLCNRCHSEVHDGMATITSTGPSPEQGLEAVKEAGLLFGRHHITKDPNLCGSCGKAAWSKSSLCKECWAQGQPSKITWPTFVDLVGMVAETNIRQVAKKLGVSDPSVAKRIKRGYV